MYRCPLCIGMLASRPGELWCDRCRIAYPVRDDIADFSQGHYYDQFDESTVLTEEHQRALEREMEGAISRITAYYGPHIARLRPEPSLRILDAGCGNGVSVDLLRREGHQAWGIDLSSLRKWQWRQRESRAHLAVADGARLPFSDGFFDVVLCSGVLEHVGVQEMGGAEYRVTVLPDRDAARRAFLEGLLRVVAPGGTLFMDFPNGAFPIDFWHNTAGGKARFHSPKEGFLPTFGEVVRLARTVDPRIRVDALSPNGRLQFRQVRQHWYGRAFSLPMQAVFKAMDYVPRGAGTFLNPFLVVRLSKPR